MEKEELITKELLQDIYNNIDWNGVEFYLFNDGDHGYRQAGSRSPFENDVICTIPLGEGGYFSNYKELEKNDILNDINDYILEAIDHHEEEQARQEALRKEFYHD